MAAMESAYTERFAPSIVISTEHHNEMRGPDDDWSGTTDPAKRRKIQNRLHQRAWRKRQAMRRKLDVIDKHADAEACPSQLDSARPETVYGEIVAPPSDSWVGIGDVNLVQQGLARFANYANARYLEGSPRTDLLLTLIKFNVFRALMMNDQDLGFGHSFLQCDAISPFYGSYERTSSALAKSPASLRPTKLQLVVEHHPWIDLLPDPKMRTNILELGDEYDDGPLCHDIVDNRHGSQSEGLIVWGDPCDVRSWEIGEDFYLKWASILRGCYDMFRATNYWRTKRGERRLFPGNFDDP